MAGIGAVVEETVDDFQRSALRAARRGVEGLKNLLWFSFSMSSPLASASSPWTAVVATKRARGTSFVSRVGESKRSDIFDLLLVVRDGDQEE